MAFELSPHHNVSVNSELSQATTSNGFHISDIELDDSDSIHQLSQLSRSLSLRSYNKWSPSQTGVTLAFQDVSVYAMKSNRKKFKRIINNVTGVLTSGSLVALMGSSGAGKSTLMSALAYRSPSNTTVQGHILVNGCPVGPFMYRLSGFVHQEDLFYGSLTVREHMLCMAHLKLDRRVCQLQIDRIIDEILEETGLKKCANTRIGEEGEGKMLSGGEKKRLAFATELLTHPAILFCDEPTTGLDSFNAQKLIGTLQNLARSQNTAIMCTIHQPSSQLFAMFDQVLLLAEGRIAFFGTPKEAISFFDDLGYNCPPNYNPADYLIGVLATESGQERASQRVAQRICDNFAVSSHSQQRDLIVNLEMHMFESGNYKVKDELKNYKKPFWHKTVCQLIKRSLINVVRDPTVQLLRILQKIGIAIMAGLCFSGAIDITQQTGIQAIQGALFIFVSENTFTPMYSVLSVFPQTFPIFLRETKSGLYSTAQYYIANMAAMLPGLILEPTIFAVIAYFLASLRPTFYAFFFTVLASVLVMNVSTSCGCFFSAAFSSISFAMAWLVPFDYILMITAGNFIKLESLPPFLSFLGCLSWLMYGNEAMSIVQFEDIKNITCAEDRPDLPCFRTGEEVLANFNFSPGDLYYDLLSMVVLYLGFHLLGYLFLWRRSKRS